MRKRLSYANVTATLALAVALGTGGAWAANSIHGDEIKDGTLRGKKLRDGTVPGRKITDTTLRNKDLASNTVRGNKIKESTLGKVPDAADADTLDGIGPSGFLKGAGRHSAGRTTGTGGGENNVIRTLTTPVGDFVFKCGGANANTRYVNTTPGSADVFLSFTGDDVGTNYNLVASGGPDVGYATTAVIGPELVELRATKGNAFGILRVGEARNGTNCIWNWDLVTSG